MIETFTRLDVSDQLRTEEDARLYLEPAFEEDLGDGRLIRAALSDIVRGRNMSELVQEIGMTREGLSEALSENGNPSFGTVLKIIRVLGTRLGVDGNKLSRTEMLKELWSDVTISGDEHRGRWIV